MALGSLSAEDARRTLEALASARRALEAAGVDLVPIAPLSPTYSACDAAREALVCVAEPGGLESWQVDGHPGVMVIDRNGRVVALAALGAPCDAGRTILGIAAQIAPLAGHEPARTVTFAAPVLIVPGVMSRGALPGLHRPFRGFAARAGPHGQRRWRRRRAQARRQPEVAPGHRARSLARPSMAR